jgi:3-phosphoshikimate 1-carboxyvinyltransferase
MGTSLQCLGIVGLGLIGGSFALAARKALPGIRIAGFDMRASEMSLAKRMGAIDEAASSVDWLARHCDLLLLAVPVQAVRAVLEEIHLVHRPELLITDVGSVKGVVAQAFSEVFGCIPSRVVLGHPIAGSEKSGMEAARADLFEHHKVILTPVTSTDPAAFTLVKQLWLAFGAEVLAMEPGHHDEVLAATSHLPHLLAFSLVDTLAGKDDNKDIFRYAAGGFRDFTRIAASDPIMWRDIFLSNRNAVLKALDQYVDGLGQLRAAIDAGDSRFLMGVFSRAKAAREHFSRMLEQKSYNSMSQEKSITFIARSKGPVTGDIRVPGDKSISHRSIMLGSLAEGVTEIEGFLEGEDALATLQAFRDMGVVIEGPDRGKVTVYGVGLHGLQAPAGTLYLGNSGTSMRLLTGLLAAQSFNTELTGDASLNKRPMERVAGPLRKMGAIIETAENGRPPVKIKGGQTLTGIRYAMPVASAQVKSAILLAGLYAGGDTEVSEPAPTRDHSERMLRGFGYEVAEQANCVTVTGGGKLTATRIDVPSDISSAAFFLVAASITPGSDLTLRHVGINPTRTGVIEILRLMGADIDLFNPREVGGEPVADIRVKYAPLTGIRIPESLVPLAIDEFPVIFIAAVCAQGETTLTGAEELRVKESDRIQVMADGLASLGVSTEVRQDGICIRTAELGGGTVNSHGDHRIAMAFSVAALRSTGDVTILDCANVATSFPGFVELANETGFSIGVKTDG